jgi:small multidrug resistance pump
MKFLILLFAIFTNVLASVLIKIAITSPRKFPSITDSISAFYNWPFWFGLLMYGLTFILYVISLERFPLSIVHPVMTSGTIASVALFSIFLFREPFFWTTIVGIILILAGVVLITAQVR